MSTIPTGRVWKTQDGRVLDIHWMDTLHLARTFNLLIRNNHLDRQRAEHIKSDKNAHFVAMREELKNRGAYKWSGAPVISNGEFFEQIIVEGVQREDIKTLCMMRAMLDTNIFWPPKKPGAIRDLRESSVVTLDAIHKVAATKPHPDWHKLLTKFTEYRLERG